MSKICTSCVASVPDDSMFCPICGKPFTQQAGGQPNGINGQPYSQPYGGTMNPHTAGRNGTIKLINMILAVIAVIQIIVICFIRPGWLRSDSVGNKGAEISAVSVISCGRGGDLRE